MKKHLCRPQDQRQYLMSNARSTHTAACDPLLEVPYNGRRGRSKRLTEEELVKQMDKGNICKACIRIVVVERLSGIRPRLNHSVTVDIAASIGDFSKAMATMGITMADASERIGRMAKIMGPILDGGVKVTPPIISIPKDFSWKGTFSGRFHPIDTIVGMVGDVTA